MMIGRFRIAQIAACLCLLPLRSAGAQNPNLPSQSNLGVSISVAGLRVPPKAWEHYDRARRAAMTGDEAEFTREANAAFKIEPRFAALYVLRATQEVHRGQVQEGLDDVMTARRIESGVAWSGVTLASAYNSLHRYVDAFLVLDSLRAPESTTWQAAYEHARSANGRADVEAALHWSALALKIAPPDCIDVHLIRATALQLAHRNPEAAHELRAYLAADTTHTPRADVLAVLARLEDHSIQIAAN